MYKVGFCVSGNGYYFKAMVANKHILDIEPTIAVLDVNASSDLEAFCIDNDIKFVKLKKMTRRKFDTIVTKSCIDADLDLLVLTFYKIIKPKLVRHYRNKIINVHYGTLPAFKGFGALQAGIDSGSRYTGATIHDVDEGVDTGQIISQCILGVRRGEDSDQLADRMYNLSKPMLLQIIKWHRDNRIEYTKNGIWVTDAVYGEYPISPSLEDAFV